MSLLTSTLPSLPRSSRSFVSNLSSAGIDEDFGPEFHFVFKAIVSEANLLIGDVLFDKEFDSDTFTKSFQINYVREFGHPLTLGKVEFCKKHAINIYKMFFGTNFFDKSAFDICRLIDFLVKKNIFSSPDELTSAVQNLLECFMELKIDLSELKAHVFSRSVEVSQQIAKEYIVDFLAKIPLASSELPFTTMDELHFIVLKKFKFSPATPSGLTLLFKKVVFEKEPEISIQFAESFDPYHIAKKNFKINPLFNAEELALKVGILWSIYTNKPRVHKFSAIVTIADFMKTMASISKVNIQPIDFLIATQFGLRQSISAPEVIFECQNLDISKENVLYFDQIQVLFFLRILEVNDFFNDKNPLYNFIKRYDRFFSYPSPELIEPSSLLTKEFLGLIKSLKDLKAYSKEEVEALIESSFDGLDKSSIDYKILHFEHKTTFEDNIGQSKSFILDKVYQHYTSLKEVLPLLESLGANHEKIVHALLLYFAGIFKTHLPIVDFAKAAGRLQFNEHRKLTSFESIRALASRVLVSVEPFHIRQVAFLWERNKDCVYAWLKIFPENSLEMADLFESMRKDNPKVSHDLVVEAACDTFAIDRDDVEAFYKAWWYQGEYALKSHDFGLRIKGCSVTDMILSYLCIEVYNVKPHYTEEDPFNLETAIIEASLLFKERCPDLLFSKAKCLVKLKELS